MRSEKIHRMIGLLAKPCSHHMFSDTRTKSPTGTGQLGIELCKIEYDVSAFAIKIIKYRKKTKTTKICNSLRMLCQRELREVDRMKEPLHVKYRNLIFPKDCLWKLAEKIRRRANLFFQRIFGRSNLVSADFRREQISRRRISAAEGLHTANLFLVA
jgi:hypothetical protein